jgi:hypothetical protein
MTGSPDAAPSPHLRLREGGIASLFLLAATLALVFIARIDVVVFAPQHVLYLVTAAFFALSIPGPVLPVWDLPGQLFLWNAIGWGIGLTLFGLASVGSMPMLPLILAAFAVSFWPRTPETTVPWQVIAIVLLGGLVVCRIFWGDVAFDTPFLPGDLG